MATYRQFFTDVLAELGIPATDANLNALASVSILEGLNNRYNPLNSVVPMGTSTPFNSVGVQDYKNYNQGVAGTVKLLQGSHWSNVVSTLRTGNDAQIRSAFKQAYTWDPNVQFNASESQTRALLDTSLGSDPGSSPSGAKDSHFGQPAPPFDPAKLPTKLSASQRDAIIKWTSNYVHAVFKANDPTYALTPNDIAKQLHGFPDKDLIQEYSSDVTAYNLPPGGKAPDINKSTGGGLLPGLPSWTHSLGKMLSWLTTLHNWQRVGLFTLGAIILLFAAFTMFGNSEIGKVIPTA